MTLVRTTIRIDDNLYRRAKASAARQGVTVGQLIEDAVRAALRPLPRDADDLPELPTFGHGGVLPGVDLDDAKSLRDVMDMGTPLDALR